jgi:hypothetical protein
VKNYWLALLILTTRWLFIRQKVHPKTQFSLARQRNPTKLANLTEFVTDFWGNSFLIYLVSEQTHLE